MKRREMIYSYEKRQVDYYVVFCGATSARLPRRAHVQIIYALRYIFTVLFVKKKTIMYVYLKIQVRQLTSDELEICEQVNIDEPERQNVSLTETITAHSPDKNGNASSQLC